jgi:hypothetical protein
MKEWEVVHEDITDVMNDMYSEGEISDMQKHGHIVCLPKTSDPVSPDNYRPLTLLNTDYKLLMRIIANRLRPWLEDILHRNQFCGRVGKSGNGCMPAMPNY